ncbi:CHASE2 domain-containing protein [Pannonibacter tanglangensis]|uniref:CHASE2 domain-containing protein n=1 Tax=Pannonibacter tanglangensis TaxID=2750084 RepID=A0ABW9ZKL4_9HYPH|nr:adenylate/guanylate cyclase domain-containing protein [Pannonibacter sp. XCT-34]NBN64929.1 CHASE2 domain-containing protein [Pannonibacter sp. XCT-34]
MRLQLPPWLALAALLAGGAWAAWLGAGHLSGAASLLDRAEAGLLDLRVLAHGPRPAPDDVMIVAIDDATVAAAGRYPLDRSQLADVVDGLRSAGAAAVAVDMLLVDATTAEADARLARSLAAMPAVIAAAGRFATDRPAVVGVPRTVGELRPLPLLGQSASVGLVNVATDAGGTPRHVPLVFLTGAGPAPSLVLRGTGLARGEDPAITPEGLRIGATLQPLDLGWHLPLRYYGPGGTIRTVSAASFLRSESMPASASAARPPDTDDGAVRGKLVLLGVTATAVGDRFSTPFDQVLPGVEVLATGVANLLDGAVLRRDQTVRMVDAAAAVGLGLAGVAAFALCPPAVASVISLVLVAGWLAVVVLAYGAGLWLAAALPVVASLPPVAAVALARQILDRHRMRRLTAAGEALGRLQAPALARRIAEDPAFLAEPVEREAAILFIDLAGYTGLSERLGPARTRAVLKTFHTLVVDLSGQHGGVVLNFMGDGAMIGFGIPDPRAEDAANACRCAFALTRGVADWVAQSGLSEETNSVRIGLHRGPVILSRLGHDNQEQITVTGDCVNVASRLMEVGKGFGSAITVSCEVLRAARPHLPRPLAPPREETVPIRGRQESLTVGLWTMAEVP